MTGWLINWWCDPEKRLRFAVRLLVFSCIAWPMTHILILITKPPELATWVGHLLLAISWLAIIFTALDIIVSCDVRKQQDD